MKVTYCHGMRVFLLCILFVVTITFCFVGGCKKSTTEPSTIASSSQIDPEIARLLKVGVVFVEPELPHTLAEVRSIRVMNEDAYRALVQNSNIVNYVTDLRLVAMLTTEELKMLARFGSLKTLDIQVIGGNFSNADWAFLAGLTQLQSFRLRYGEGVTLGVVRYLPTSANLDTVELESIDPEPDAIRDLVRLRTLKRLHLSFIDMDDALGTQLASMKKLEQISVMGDGRKLSAPVMIKMLQLPQLHSLLLGAVNLGHEIEPALNKVQFKRLSLTNARGGGIDFSGLDTRKLEYLSIGGWSCGVDLLERMHWQSDSPLQKAHVYAVDDAVVRPEFYRQFKRMKELGFHGGGKMKNNVELRSLATLLPETKVTYYFNDE